MMERSRLLTQALVKFTSGLLLVGALLFGSAGTFAYPNAWLLCGLLFLPMLAVGVILFLKAPELLAKRLSSKETEKGQTALLFYSAGIFIVGFVLSGLGFRFGWRMLPKGVVAAASVLLLASYGLWAEVMRENAYLSRTIEIQEGQRVVSTGLYGVVRHPMYAAALLLFLSFPLVLGSSFAFVLFLGMIPVLAARIRGEERLLESELEGYREYEQKVRYRLLPYVW